MAGAAYSEPHQALRRRVQPLVLAGSVECARCGEPIRPGEPWDLGHVDGDSSRYAGPEHRRCNRATSGRRFPAPPPPPPEREGIPADDARWSVPWLDELRRVPADAVWPRFMSVPHERACGSDGPGFIAHAEARSERPLRWWQRLVATRLLEIDGSGELCWETLLLTMARQLGKSWLLRELLLWRMLQGERFGEPQNVLHTGKDLQVCKEVMRPALYWALEQPGYKVDRGAGLMTIERTADRSRWLLRARGAVYGYSVSVGAVDEAWKVKPEVVDEGLAPTMVERAQSQLWLISTAHREATALMLVRRQAALEGLERGDGDLLIEWSAPREAAIDAPATWRQASPHWTEKRQRLVARQLEAAQSGEAEMSEDEADPVEAFRAQWLNQWPHRTAPDVLAEHLLPPGLWAWLTDSGYPAGGDLFVAVEDDFGLGAAVAVASRLDDGRIEVDGWETADWDAALLDVRRLQTLRRIRVLLVGASMLNRVPAGTAPPPAPAGGRETRLGLPLIRDLAAGGVLVHDGTTEELDQAVQQAQVKELSAGLTLLPVGPTHLLRAFAWAVNAAHRPAPMPAVY